MSWVAVPKGWRSAAVHAILDAGCATNACNPLLWGCVLGHLHACCITSFHPPHPHPLHRPTLACSPSVPPLRAVVMMTSDHGEMSMEHRQDYKNSGYEPSSRVPMIMVPFGVPAMSGAAGRVISAITSHVDVLPTIVDLVSGGSAAAPTYARGSSLVPFMLNAPPPPRKDFAFVQFHSNLVRSRFLHIHLLNRHTTCSHPAQATPLPHTPLHIPTPLAAGEHRAVHPAPGPVQGRAVWPHIPVVERQRVHAAPV